MAGWSETELAAVAANDEVKVASRRADGSLRPFVTIWAVRAGDEVYVRAAYGPETGWYRRARATGTGVLSVGGVQRAVAFVPAGAAVGEVVDAAYEAKYGRYPANIVRTVVGPAVHGLTLRLDPVEEAGA